MSAIGKLFGSSKPKTSGLDVKSPATTTPAPRDEESRTEAERVRRSHQRRGRTATVLTRFMERSGGAATTPRQTVGGGA